MATDKKFTVAGVSLHNGVWKVRYANDLEGRAKVLQRAGHTNIVLVDLGEPLEKVDCIDKLLNVDLGDEDANECVAAEAREFGFVV